MECLKSGVKMRAHVPCSIVAIVFLAVLCAPGLSHTLPDDAPDRTPEERYAELVDQARLNRVANWESEIESVGRFLRKKYGSANVQRAKRQVSLADHRLFARHAQMKRELPLLRRGETPGIVVSFSFEQPVLYDVGELRKENSPFRRYFLKVEEVLSDSECRISCTRQSWSGSQGKPLHMDDEIHLRDFIIVGMETANLIIGEELPMRLKSRVFHVIGVRDNTTFMLHPLDLDTSTETPGATL